MNKFENLYKSSRMAARITRVALSRKREVRRGGEPTSTLYALLYSPVAERLGIQKGSDAEKNAQKVTSAISRAWIKADAILDEDADYAGIDLDALAKEKDLMLNTPLILDKTVPEDMRRKVEEMEMAARKRAYEAHSNFMATYDPATSTFDDVFGYRANTSGMMGETIASAIYVVSGNDADIAALRANVLSESLCLQMCDDLVDSVSDYRKRLPNLLYALSIENPTERDRFEFASMNKAILETRRPYDIAQLFTPNTLLSYMRRFQAMSSLLPPDRRRLVQDSMAMTTYLSYSPNGTIGKINRSEIGQMLARKTKID